MSRNILLINPAINFASQNKIVNAIINKTIPTSLGVLASVLISSVGLGVKIIDEQVEYLDDNSLENLVLGLNKPRVIGISVLTINSKRAYEIAKKIKRIDPSVYIVFGGIHPSVLPEETLQHQVVDIVVRGEGEITFQELAELISNDKDYRGIQGISYRNNGMVIHNPDRPLVDDLDSLPQFPYYLFEKNIKKYSNFGAILTSRGCPYNCIFCSSRNISGRKYRYLSVQRIISDIRLLADKYKQKIICILDDNMAYNQKHFFTLLDAIIESGLNNKVCFYGSARGDNINGDMLNKAKVANFRLISFGLETGKESLMKLINKGETIEQVVAAIKMTARSGIAVAATIIFGLPGETRRDRWDIMRFIRSLPLSSVRFNILIPYPGTPLFKALYPRGEIYIKDNWENFAVQYMWESDDLPYIPKETNVYELILDTMLANFSFYFSFGGIKRMLKSSFAAGNVIRLSKKWYFSPRLIWNFLQLFFYLIRRFLYIIIKILLGKAKVKELNNHTLTRNNLKELIDFAHNSNSSTVLEENKLFYNFYFKKTFKNIIYERYIRMHRPFYSFLPFNYQLVPRMLRYLLQQRLFRNKNGLNVSFPAWPYEESLERLREIIFDKFGPSDFYLFQKLKWPESSQYALVLTHDIESADNWKWVKIIAEIEKEYGFRSSWNIVPKLYRIDYSTLDWLMANGFEIGLHGYNHDSRLIFMKENQIRYCFDSSSFLIKKYNIKGFRSPSWLRNQKLFKILQDYFVYDCSVPDVDYISAIGIGGNCSVFPYKIGKLVELPTTLLYESPILFGIKKDNLNSFWENKIAWIKRVNGLVHVVTHPDPYYGGNWEMVKIYKDFLENLKQDKDLICLLPSTVAEDYLESQNRFN